MCGIAGILTFEGLPPSAAEVGLMVQALDHRGPDEAGCHVDGQVALGHSRLSIIDIAGGRQPMSNEDGSMWLTFNGEIFNYLELRARLEQQGHRFATRSDTEVILHLYEELGEDCVHEMNGQWALALWDARRRRLFLSRDRMGVRPLFYTQVNGRFAFASEIKALFSLPGMPREIDLRGLDQILTFWAPVAPRTVFENVSELPAGHSLSIDARGSRMSAYWRPDFGQIDHTADPVRCAEELFDLLLDATRIRLRSDVPVGAYLSGGLDSTIIAAVIKRLEAAPLRTFSVTFEDAEFDESAHQQDAVDFLRTDHTQIRCTAADIAAAFPEVIRHTERPIVRTAPAPLFLLSRLVRENGFKVVLTGEGADETFGGYDIFKEAKIRAFWAAQPDSAARPQLLKRLYPYLRNVHSQPEAFLQAFFRPQPGPANAFFSHLPRWQMTSGLKLLLSPDVKQRLRSHDAYADLTQTLPADFGRWDYFSRAQYLETTLLLPGYILASQGDRVSMAHAVEARFPFLDHRLVRFASSLPPRLKMKVLNEKYILKQAAGHLIPPGVRRRTKQPYRAPDAAAFLSRSGARLPEYAEALLAPGRIAEDGIFNPLGVSQLVDKVRSGRALGTKDNMAFVTVLSTQLLVDAFVRSRALAA